MSPRLRSGLWLLGVVLAVSGASEARRAWSAERLGREVAALARPGDIAMLASDSCIYCAEARAWFGAHRVSFSECSIERDAACSARFRALMSPGTPVLVVRGRVDVGFDAERVRERLAAPV
jgi:glutaredoxin